MKTLPMKTVLVLLLLITIVACGPKGISSPQGNLTPSPYSQVETPIPDIIPTPIASMGTVTGKLVSSSKGESLGGLILYLGTLLPLTPGPGHLLNVDPSHSPSALIHQDGRFLAENVTPGEYALILWTPATSRFVPDPVKPDDEFIVKVEAGKIVDIGTMTAPQP